MKIEFSTNSYIRSHGSNPKGRGSYAFQIVEINGHVGEAEVWFSESTTFTKARQSFRQICKKQVQGINPQAHHVVVEVCP